MDRLPRELRVLFDLADVVAGPIEAAEVAARICETVSTAFELRRVVLVRYDAEHGLTGAAAEATALVRFPYLEAALETSAPVVAGDPAPGGAGETELAQLAAGPVVAVPLVLAGRCIGFLVGDRGGSPIELAVDEARLLRTLGRVAAVFVDQADRYGKLSEVNEELRRLDEAKHDFISIASHELRTPIAVVHGVASTMHLRGKELSEPQLDDLRVTLFEQTSRLRDLADKLLDLSRLEAGAIDVQPVPFRPREHLESLLPRIVPDRLDDIDVRIPPDLELESDPDGFERIVSNLVVNALRYGSPPVLVRSETGRTVRITVEDRGAGVDPQFVPQLFERFSRAERRGSGAGLGLAIAHSFAEALGGELSYRDAEPQGACFVLELPRS